MFTEYASKLQYAGYPLKCGRQGPLRSFFTLDGIQGKTGKHVFVLLNHPLTVGTVLSFASHLR